MDLSKERSQSLAVAAGAETVVAKVMALRVGFNSGNSAGLGISAGVGWSIGSFALDYAFVPYGDLGATNRVSVTWRWGR